jgi:pilus assembly protein CpaB
MRQKRLFLVLLLAVVSGAVAGYSILEFLRQRPTRLVAAEPSGGNIPVVIVARDIGLGEVITEEDVRVVSWPAGSVPEGYARSIPEVVGRGVVSDLRTNEPVLATKLAAEGEGAGLPPLIAPGMRAVTIKVDQVIGIAGFILPQYRVDVILTMAPSGGGETRSQIILQNVKALSAGTMLQRDENGQPVEVPVVTFELSPEDSEKLVLASTQGRIQMVLRNQLDLETVETNGERMSGLFSAGRRTGTVRAGTAGAASAPSIIEMYKGGARTLISY